MEYSIPQFEERYKKRSAVISMTIWLILLILLILPLFHYPTPPPGQEGIMVNLGMIDVGEGDENAAAAPMAEQPEAPAPSEEVIPEPEPIPEPEIVEAVPPPVIHEPEIVEPTPEPIAQPDPEILRQEQAAIALKKREEAKAKADQDLAIAKAKAEAAAEAQRKAQAEAQRKAAAEAQRVADAKAAAAAKAAADAAKAKSIRDGMAGLFSGNDGDGGGKGNTGTAGNQGDPNGDPNADRLTGLSSGRGNVGGGLQGRGVLSSPKLSDNSQRKGRVVVKVCVDASGNVTSAKYTQLGSSTSDPVLQRLAVENAKNYRFSKSSSATQCGNITYDFVVK